VMISDWESFQYLGLHPSEMLNVHEETKGHFRFVLSVHIFVQRRIIDLRSSFSQIVV
jgi:hypothetical protein